MKEIKIPRACILLTAIILSMASAGCIKTLDSYRKNSYTNHLSDSSATAINSTTQVKAAFWKTQVQIFVLLLICGIAAAILFELFIGSKFKSRIDLLWICLILALALPVFLFILTYSVG